MVELCTFNAEVIGSSPIRVTIKLLTILKDKTKNLKRKCKVVMLPTNKGISWFQRGFNGLIWYGGYIHSYDPNLSMTAIDNLYILSDEKIEEGDWFIANQAAFKCIEVVKGDYPYKILYSLNKYFCIIRYIVYI